MPPSSSPSSTCQPVPCSPPPNHHSPRVQNTNLSALLKASLLHFLPLILPQILHRLPSMANFQLLALASATSLLFLANITLIQGSSHTSLMTSTISSAPTFLPSSPNLDSPSVADSPALSPDMMPVLPSPGGHAEVPSISSLPTIPSSPSPPNPDEVGPDSAFAPLGSSSSSSLAVSPATMNGFSTELRGVVVVLCGLVLMWWL